MSGSALGQPLQEVAHVIQAPEVAISRDALGPGQLMAEHHQLLQTVLLTWDRNILRSGHLVLPM